MRLNAKQLYIMTASMRLSPKSPPNTPLTQWPYLPWHYEYGRMYLLALEDNGNIQVYAGLCKVVDNTPYVRIDRAPIVIRKWVDIGAYRRWQAVHDNLP